MNDVEAKLFKSYLLRIPLKMLFKAIHCFKNGANKTNYCFFSVSKCNGWHEWWILGILDGCDWAVSIKIMNNTIKSCNVSRHINVTDILNKYSFKIFNSTGYVNKGSMNYL